jgi:hypothetical protein
MSTVRPFHSFKMLEGKWQYEVQQSVLLLFVLLVCEMFNLAISECCCSEVWCVTSLEKFVVEDLYV